MDYQTIKTLAKDQGCRVTDLIALAPQNDPFYVGRPADETMAHWFADVWNQYQRLEFGGRGRLRRLHYNLVGAPEPVRLPTTLTWKVKKTGEHRATEVYVNEDRCWQYLELAGKCARYLGLVSADAFVDRRNPEAIIFARSSEWDATPEYVVTDGDTPWEPVVPDLPQLDDLPSIPDWPDFMVYGYDDIEQPYHVELWAEKSTQNDILMPICELWNVNLITGLGELSITSVVEFIERVRRAGKPAHILYVSDYDPAGLGMPVSISRKIEWFQSQEGADDLAITLEPIILTSTQVDQYELPRAPVKASDARKAGWEEVHGKGATELDALAALRPGEMERIITEAIQRHRDPTLTRRARDVGYALRERLDGYREHILGENGSAVEEIRSDYNVLRAEFEQTRERFAELVHPFQQRIDTYQGRLDDIGQRWQELNDTFAEWMKEGPQVDMDEFALPEADLPPRANDMLYASDRGYFEQLGAYQHHRTGNGNNGVLLTDDTD